MPAIALNMSIRGQLLSGVRFNPAYLFSSSEPGVWYDPSDLTTMFQDAAGTIPVTAAGQPVGLVLDKSKQQTWIDVTGAIWTKTAGDGVVTVFGNQITITGATTTTLVTRTEGSIPFMPGKASMTVRADFTSATGVQFWLRGVPTGLTNGVAITSRFNLNNSSLERFDVSTGTVTFTILDFSYWAGFHATQATAASRPTYGIVPRTGQRNLLTYSEDFSNAIWGKRAATATAGVITATAGAGDHGVNQAISSVTGNLTFSVKVKAGTSNFVWLTLSPSYGLGNYATAVVNLSTGAISKTQSGGTLSITSSSVSAADVNGFYRVTFSVLSGSTGMTAIVGVGNSATPTITSYGSVDFTASGTETVFVKEAQLETGSTATAYQRVVTAFDVTETGVPSLGYLSFDGVDDFLVTPTITPNIDKAQVFAGVRKLSDAAAGILVESSNNVGANAGSFYLAAPEDATVRYSSLSRGSSAPTIAMGASTTGSAPDTAVLTATHDIAGDLSTIRRNAVDGTSATSDKGTGNFLAYPFYIGRRNGISVTFNGQLYSLITRFGANLDANTISQTETWVNSKTGAY